MVDFICGDSREALRGLPDQSVNCVITSPPYFGLRDYGVSGQIGLEPTLEAYINELMTVFAEVKRVLRDDGTFWLNLGDSYNSNSSRRNAGFNARYHGCSDAGKQADTDLQKPERPRVGAISSKDLIGMPWRVAFALQADGWILRSDIIWAKGNPMPESVTDRPTRCHEYLFMFAKSERYAYDADSIREPCVYNGPPKPGKQAQTAYTGLPVHSGRLGENNPAGRNKRTVWTVNPKPFPGAHFATFPPALVEPALLAGCPVGGTVLDPFAGAGTVGLVAQQHGRNAILVELNPSYVTLAKERLCAAT